MIKYQAFSGDHVDQLEKHYLKYNFSDKNRRDFLYDQYRWLEFVKEKFPEISLKFLDWFETQQTYGYFMEKIENYELYEEDLIRICNIIDQFKNSNAFKTNKKKWSSYIEYLKKIKINSIDLNKYFNKLELFHEIANKSLSFCHGDLTIYNILKRKNRSLAFIDSNYKDNLWQSYLLDYAKLYQEIRFDDLQKLSLLDEILKQRFSIELIELIYLLEISHYIRMIPYVKDENKLYVKEQRLKTLLSNI